MPTTRFAMMCDSVSLSDDHYGLDIRGAGRPVFLRDTFPQDVEVGLAACLIYAPEDIRDVPWAYGVEWRRQVSADSAEEEVFARGSGLLPAEANTDPRLESGALLTERFTIERATPGPYRVRLLWESGQVLADLRFHLGVAG